jgi:hypothetical protein
MMRSHAHRVIDQNERVVSRDLNVGSYCDIGNQHQHEQYRQSTQDQLQRSPPVQQDGDDECSGTNQ